MKNCILNHFKKLKITSKTHIWKKNHWIQQKAQVNILNMYFSHYGCVEGEANFGVITK